jgi:hypothetical protein
MYNMLGLNSKRTASIRNGIRPILKKYFTEKSKRKTDMAAIKNCHVLTKVTSFENVVKNLRNAE